MKVLHDGAGGITEISKRHFARVIKGIRPIEVNISRNREFSFELFGLNNDGHPVIVLESGFNCGYPGEGPHGSKWALNLLGVSDEIAKRVFTQLLLSVNFQGTEPSLQEVV